MDDQQTIQALIDRLRAGEDIAELGEINVVRNGSLALLAYKDSCQRKKPAEWTDAERICRGLILDLDEGRVVARPFDKFWNYGEDLPAPGSNIIEIADKLDGSLGIIYFYNGKWNAATRGSFDSEQARWAEMHFGNSFEVEALDIGVTYLVEIIYPANRVVVDYYDREALVLIGARRVEDGYDFVMNDMSYNTKSAMEFAGFEFPQMTMAASWNTAAELAENVTRLPSDREGVVVRFSDGKRLKMKGDAYKEMHKWISYFSLKAVAAAVLENRLQELDDTCPEHYRDAFETFKKTILAEDESTVRYLEEWYRGAPKADRKTFALWVKAVIPQEWHACMFQMLDGRDTRETRFKVLFDV